MNERLTEVSEIERAQHYHLPAGMKCYFWGEYSARQPAEYSETNQLVMNFKKSRERFGHNDWRFKAKAIKSVADVFARSFKWNAALEQKFALIPIPPSKPRTSPTYDSRMVDAITQMRDIVGLPLDIRDCLSFSGRYGASHRSGVRPTPDQLFEDLSFDVNAGRPHESPGGILLFDDMLTSGAHLLAATRRLGEFFPNVTVVSVFVARRAIPPEENPFTVY